MVLRDFVMKTGARAAKGVNKDDQAVRAIEELPLLMDVKDVLA